MQILYYDETTVFFPAKIGRIQNVVHAISYYKEHCIFSNTIGPYFWANFE